jgi:hypothetical protein
MRMEGGGVEAVRREVRMGVAFAGVRGGVWGPGGRRGG